MVDSIEKYIDENKDRFLEELVSWLKIPSISTLSQHKHDVLQASRWAEEKLKSIGFPTVEVIEGEGHPLVFAEWTGLENQPTLLIYGHYDVQPVDPLSEWLSDPFEPRIENGNIYGRGATDDKGQIMIVLAALEAWVKTNGSLPINIKILLEGEEEAGGEFVDKFVRSRGDRLRCDAALICDTHMNSVAQPSLIIGLRGILYMEIAAQGARSDLHSGSYGGVAPKPIHALCLLISRLKDEDGRISVPELYDFSSKITAEEHTFWLQNRNNMEKRLYKEMGVNQLFGENHLSPHERMGARPTFEVHGIRGGFIGEGAKTVIPSEALAKVSLRLVAGMDPDKVFEHFVKVVEEKMPSGYSVRVKNLHGGSGVLVSPENIFVEAAAASIEKVYDKRPVFMREGGSIPIAALFDAILDVPVVLMGFGLPDDGAHGPNEKFSLSQFHKGIVTVADYFSRLRK